jgi:cysteine desulfuration protein SufE
MATSSTLLRGLTFLGVVAWVDSFSPVIRRPLVIQIASTRVDDELAALNLPQRLKEIVAGLRSLPDDKMRYKQVLYLAGKASALADEFKIPENKVPGCLSTVHVNAVPLDGMVYFTGDSDSQLTKGLLTVLMNGLSGYSPGEICNVNPEFIKYAGLGASLTPG